MRIDRRLAAQFDWPLCLLCLALVLTGIVTIYSATCGVKTECSDYLAKKQAYWALIGLAAMVTAITIDYQRLDRMAYPFYLLVLGLLVLVSVRGFTSGGSQRWLDLHFFALQPSELAKLMLVVVLAKILRYDPSDSGYRLPDLWSPFLLVLPVLTLILLQPDLGTAVLVGLIFFTVVVMSGLHARSLIRLVLVLLASLPLAWQFLKPYQQTRIWTFIDPDQDPLGAGYHVFQSKIAIGSGQLWGKGYQQGSQNRLEFLPEQHTDFIFSVFAEEWGFVGCLVLLSLYASLLLVSLRVVRRARDRFGATLAVGMTAIIFWQVVINISMVTGVLPVVGIPLPLLSYGGSSLVTTMLAVGVLINISTRRYTF